MKNVPWSAVNGDDEVENVEEEYFPKCGKGIAVEIMGLGSGRTEGAGRRKELKAQEETTV